MANQRTFYTTESVLWAKDFGERVRHMRKTTGMTQAAFAAALNLSGINVLGGVERGRKCVSLVAVMLILRFARERGMSADELLFGIDPVCAATVDRLKAALSRKLFDEALAAGRIM